MDSNEKKYASKKEFQNILDDLFKILKEINHILIINTNEVFLKENLALLKNDLLISDTVKLLNLINYDLSKIAYSNVFLEFIPINNKNVDEKKIKVII